MTQIEILVGPPEPSKRKLEFLHWLDRFSRVPRSFKVTLVNFQFSDGELDHLASEIEKKYKLKVKFLRNQR